MQKIKKTKILDLLPKFNDEITNFLNLSGNKVCSFDLFDTLLMRNNMCELERFWISSDKMKKILINKNTKEIFSARLNAHKLLYRIPNSNNEKEPKLSQIFKTMLAILDHNYDILNDLIQEEINFECQNLKLNETVLFGIIQCLEKDATVIAVSDMYLEVSHLKKIFEFFEIEKLFSKIYVSSEIKLSKRSGQIFDHLKEKMPKETVFIHTGDNFRSDIINASTRGFNTIHFPLNKKTLEERQKKETNWLKNNLEKMNFIWDL